jgi:hypothetical protein
LGYNIDAINRSRRDVSSSISIDTTRLNPYSIISKSSRLATSSRGFSQMLDSSETSGSFASAKVVIQSLENVRWGIRIV